MRSTFAVTVALLVTTALVGGVAGVAGAQSTTTTAEHCEFPVEMTDATGETVTLEEPPERITTTNPSAAQVLWEIGAQDRVVGVTQFAMYLDGAEEKTDVSADFGVDVEKVVDTDPDLVLAPNASSEAVEPLREAGVTVYHFNAATSIDDVAEKTEITGELIGNCEEAAETNEWMHDEVADAQERVDGLENPTALRPLDAGEFNGFVAAEGTFIHDMMTVAGTQNVATGYDQPYPQVSAEDIIEADPEVLIVEDPDDPLFDEEPYAGLTAVQEENYVVIETHWVNQPAPRSVVETTGSIADGVVEYNEQLETETPTPTAEPDEAEDDTDDAAPGFGVVAALVATLGAALLARRD